MTKMFKTLVMFVFIAICGTNVSMAHEDEITSMGFEYVEFDGQQVPIGKEVTIEDATKYVETKSYQLIGALQKIAKPITLVVMVGCGLMAVISGLSGRSRDGGSGAWMWAAVVAAICYVGVMFAPIILELIVNFMQP